MFSFREDCEPDADMLFFLVEQMGGDYPLTGKTYTPWNSQKPVRTGTVRVSHSSVEKGVQTEGLHDTIGILLACIDQCALQTPLFRHLLHDTPLLEATSTHAEMLLAMEASVQTCSSRHGGVQLFEHEVVGSGTTTRHARRCMIGPMEGALFGPTWMSRGIQWGSLACAGSLGRLCAPEGAPENKPAPKDGSVPTIHFQVRVVSFREGIWTKNNEDNEGKLSFRWSTSPW